jgi:uncharacterized protein (DUF1501 family)
MLSSALLSSISRRDFFRWGGASLGLAALPAWATAKQAPQLLVLVELRGGNDGLNTVLPADEGRYRDLRPRLALGGDAVTAFASGVTLNAALAPWKPLWQAGEMAVIQGVGYPQPNLSHFRSIEIWDTAADSTQFLQSGWLTRAAQAPYFKPFGADGVIIGAPDLGPLAGGARAVAMSDPERFARQARLAQGDAGGAQGMLAHVLKVEADVVRAGAELRSDVVFKTEFPRGGFGNAVRAGAQVAASGKVPVLRLTQSGFDTHQNQQQRHAQLLGDVAQGVMALRSALQEAGLWERTLVLTYSEFGRRARENGSGGTDHGTANVMFAFGPRVRSGVHGDAPSLTELDRDGNLRHTVDFRAVYATVLEQWWRLDSRAALGRKFAPVPFLRA